MLSLGSINVSEKQSSALICKSAYMQANLLHYKQSPWEINSLAKEKGQGIAVFSWGKHSDKSYSKSQRIQYSPNLIMSNYRNRDIKYKLM